MNNVNEKLQALKVKEQEAINYCNTKLSDKGVTEQATSVVDIGNKIESIQSGNPYQILQDKFFYSGRNNYQYAFAYSKITYDDLSNLVLDTSKGTVFTGMFWSCTNLTTIPQLDTSKGTDFSSMFRNCTNLTTIPQLDTSKGDGFANMFHSCTTLTTIPQIDTSNGTNFNCMFYNFTTLTTIPQLDTSKGTDFSNMFTYCYSLENISFVANCIKKSISFIYSDKLTNESIQSIIDGLADLTGKTAQTVAFHPDVKNKLTEVQIASVISKNWNIA